VPTVVDECSVLDEWLEIVEKLRRVEVERVALAIAPLLGWSVEHAAAAVDAELARRAAIEVRWRRN